MMEFNIRPGLIVIMDGKRYQIKAPLSLERVLIQAIDSEETKAVLLTELHPDTQNSPPIITQNNADSRKRNI